MTAVATAKAEPSLTDLSLEELIDERVNITAYIDRVRPELMRANKALTDVDTMIALRMEETKARKFERGGFRGAFVTQKRGSASVVTPDALRKELEAIPDVPRHALDEALQIITPPPTVKPDLRKVRKLADYGDAAAKVVKAHITEAIEFEALVIEEIRPMVNVTASPEAIAS